MWNKYCKRYRPYVVKWNGGSHVWKDMLQAGDFSNQEILWEPRESMLAFGIIIGHNWKPCNMSYLSHIIHVMIATIFNEEVCRHTKNDLGDMHFAEERVKPL